MSYSPDCHSPGHFTPAEIEAARTTGGLLSMELETSHRCNLRCVYCYNGSGRSQQNELSQRELLSVIDQAVQLGLRRLVIIGGGEPLMHPNICDLIEYARSRQLAIELFTNGVLMTAELAERLYGWAWSRW